MASCHGASRGRRRARSELIARATPELWQRATGRGPGDGVTPSAYGASVRPGEVDARQERT
ncbi:hypothetical protein FTX61_02000 [Nitriliruptoraceae bacterium ZYF776]|nr:hypothetical protein [Profundirhabdus halotolerans]